VDEYFCFGSASGDRHDAGRPAQSARLRRHRLFCNPKRRGVATVASLAAAKDDHQERARRRRPPSHRDLRCGSAVDQPVVGRTTSFVGRASASRSDQRPSVAPGALQLLPVPALVTSTAIVALVTTGDGGVEHASVLILVVFVSAQRTSPCELGARQTGLCVNPPGSERKVAPASASHCW
jgi:hypothetical protein